MGSKYNSSDAIAPGPSNFFYDNRISKNNFGISYLSHLFFFKGGVSWKVGTPHVPRIWKPGPMPIRGTPSHLEGALLHSLAIRAEPRGGRFGARDSLPGARNACVLVRRRRRLSGACARASTRAKTSRERSVAQSGSGAGKQPKRRGQRRVAEWMAA